MAARTDDRGDREPGPTRQALTFSLAGLPSPTTVTIDLSRSARPHWYAHLAMGRPLPVLQIDSGYGTPTAFTAVRIQPHRIELEIASAPAVLTLDLQVVGEGPFLFGWLQVPADVRSTIETTVERLNIIGAGYWAVPVWEPARPPDGGHSPRADEMPTITHQRQSPRIAPERATEAAETARSGRDKPSS